MNLRETVKIVQLTHSLRLQQWTDLILRGIFSLRTTHNLHQTIHSQSINRAAIN